MIGHDGEGYLGVQEFESLNGVPHFKFGEAMFFDGEERDRAASTICKSLPDRAEEVLQDEA